MTTELEPNALDEGDVATHWIDAIERSCQAIRGDVAADHTLHGLASAALLSPFHFHRVFCRLTGTTPGRYLAACRMVEAMRLLISDSDSVTDICWQVGYSSLGTFTSQFTRLVGVSPGRFRQQAKALADERFESVLELRRRTEVETREVQFSGIVHGTPGCDSPALVGLFRSGIPQQRPAACAIVRPPAVVPFAGLPDGTYYPRAYTTEPATRVGNLLAGATEHPLYVASAEFAVRVVDGAASHHSPFELRLRPHTLLDPPLVLALPLLGMRKRTAPAGMAVPLRTN